VEQVVERVIHLSTDGSAPSAAGGLSKPIDGPWHAPGTMHIGLPGVEYPVHLGPGLLHDAGPILRKLGMSGTVAVVTNPLVGRLYANVLCPSLQAAGFSPVMVEMPDGEAHKTLATVAMLYGEFVRCRLERSSAVLALGGGVVGDVTGFAAATFLRGLPLVQVPTTLLAMVDSSLGGKTGVDLPAGKNLVGAFCQPSAVLGDTNTLATLPPAEVRGGLAEVVKSAVIGDPELFDILEAEARCGDLGCWYQSAQANGSTGEDVRIAIIRRAAAVKVAVVAADPTEQGRRAVLNLGHTIGHAVEQASGYGYRHGEAVSIGLVAATRMAVRLGLCAPEVAQRVEVLLQGIGLPVRYTGIEPPAVLASLSVDKKRRQGRARWVVPLAIGVVIITDEVPQELVQAIVADLAGGGEPLAAGGRCV
jgi:3-dehydroquinate synthase